MPKKPAPSRREHAAAEQKSPAASKSTVKSKSKPASAAKTKGKAKRAAKPKAAPAVILSASDGVGGETVTGDVSKHAGGRPTDYREEYCEKVLEWGRQGKSRTWMAANLGCDRRTLDNWADVHPKFFRALSYAKALEQAHWEDLGHFGLSADKFNNGVWSKSMAARFPDEWREKQEHSGPAGGPIQHQVGVSWMTEDQAKARGWA